MATPSVDEESTACPGKGCRVRRSALLDQERPSTGSDFNQGTMADDETAFGGLFEKIADQRSKGVAMRASLRAIRIWANLSALRSRYVRHMDRLGSVPVRRTLGKEGIDSFRKVGAGRQLGDCLEFAGHAFFEAHAAAQRHGAPDGGEGGCRLAG